MKQFKRYADTGMITAIFCFLLVSAGQEQGVSDVCEALYPFIRETME